MCPHLGNFVMDFANFFVYRWVVFRT